MNIKEKRAALLKETAETFNSNNRSIKDGKCKYYTNDNCGCAIGRKIPDKNLCKKMDELVLTEIRFIATGIPELYSQIPLELRELGIDFLIALQSLHDASNYWNETGLSDTGKARYDAIYNTYCAI